MSTGTIYLKKKEERRIISGHLWVFSNEIEKVEGELQNGDLVRILDSHGNFLGTGFYNYNSLIAARLLSREEIKDLKHFFTSRIKIAYDLRRTFYPLRKCYRLAFSESDYLPGLIIDKYNNTFILQVYSAGMQKNLSLIADVLIELFNAENIFTKNESNFRRMEGLPETDELILGSKQPELIDDGSIKYNVDFEKSHKTGFYFDQSDNRFFIERLSKNRTVLDAFCNAGGFGLHSAKAGATEITFVDSSAAEIESVKINYELNSFTQPVHYENTDVFDFLEKCIAEKQKFDIVMIDPPAFAKNKKTLPQAKKGYEKLNRLAMQVTADSGYLVTSSCSYHLPKEEFIEIINKAAVRSRVEMQLIHYNTASLDHPELPGMKETSYLKFAVLSRVTPIY